MKKYLLLLISLFCTLFPSTATVRADENTVRVAFLPDMFGFYHMEENGNYSGYNYDYLMTLAQHTGWNYEFVIIQEGLVSTSLVKAQEMLENGEIDLLGPVSTSTATFDQFESGTRNYGTYRYNLYSALHKYAITMDNYFLQDTLKVALVPAFPDLNEKFFHLMEGYGYDIEVTYADSHGHSHELLFNEEVDAIINLDMSANSTDLDYLTTIDRIPFHFVSTKGNTQLMAEMDEAIEKVLIVEPDIHQILLEKHFGTRYDGEFMFTEAETAVLHEMESIRVGMLANEPPYQYYDKNGNNVGISVDVLRTLEEIIGVPFEIVWKNTHTELAEAIEREEIDMISTVPNDFPLGSALSVVLTNPYISSSSYLLTSTKEVDDPEILFHFVSSNIPYYDTENMRTTVNIAEDLKLMNDKGSYSIFCDPYIAAYYLRLLQLDNIEIKSMSNVRSEMSFGVGAHIDVNFIGMMNRAILYLDSLGLDDTIYKHTSVQPEYSVWQFIMLHSTTIFAVLLVLAVIIIFYVRSIADKFKEMSRRDSFTKLYSSGYFHEYATEKVPQLSSGALLLIDIDYFKNVNDTYGHQSGDDVIKQVAINMERFAKANHFNGRLGGDEFAVFVEGAVNKEDLETMSKSILDAMSHNETGIYTTLSMGAFIFDTPCDYKTLYKSADNALYKVKENGRNGFLVETTSMS